MDPANGLWTQNSPLPMNFDATNAFGNPPSATTASSNSQSQGQDSSTLTSQSNFGDGPFMGVSSPPLIPWMNQNANTGGANSGNDERKRLDPNWRTTDVFGKM